MERKYVFLNTGMGCLTALVLCIGICVVSPFLISWIIKDSADSKSITFSFVAIAVQVVIAVVISAVVDIKRTKVLKEKGKESE